MQANVEQLMILISSVDSSASIKYSPATGKFYLSNNLFCKGDDSKFSTVNEHENTVEVAIKKCYKRIQGRVIKLQNKEEEYRLPILL